MTCWLCQFSDAQKERTAPGDESDESYSSSSSTSSTTNRNLPVHAFATPKGPQGRSRIFIKNAINLSPAICELLFCITYTNYYFITLFMNGITKTIPLDLQHQYWSFKNKAHSECACVDTRLCPSLSGSCIRKETIFRQISLVLRNYYRGTVHESVMHFEHVDKLDAAGRTEKIVNSLQKYEKTVHLRAQHETV